MFFELEILYDSHWQLITVDSWFCRYEISAALDQWLIYILFDQTSIFWKGKPIFDPQQTGRKQPCEVIVKTWGFYDVLQKDMEIGFKNNLHTAFMGW